MNLTQTKTSQKQEYKEKIYEGAITIFYKKMNQELLFLVVKNSKTENISFVSGAKENFDENVIKSAQRENKEELDLDPEQYTLEKVEVKHEFIFDEKKKERAGKRGSYQVFVSDLTNADFDIKYTEELKSVKWMTEKDVLDSLSFLDLKEVFLNAVKNLK